MILLFAWVASLTVTSLTVTSSRAGEPATAGAGTATPLHPVVGESLGPARTPAVSVMRTTAASSPCVAGGTVELDPTKHLADEPLHIGTQTYSRTLKLCDHEVILTFDDGPSPRTTPLVLRALREAGVHATFFLIGRNSRAYPALARQEFQEGHTVGHHSDTHPSFTLRGFDEASAETDIRNGIAADESAVYGKGADPEHPHVPFFRFPGFADTVALRDDLDGRGIAIFGSDLWAADWLVMTPDQERSRVMRALDRRPLHNGVILLHDTRASTAAMLPALLHELKAKGYRVVHLAYRKDAPPPPLTTPRLGEPETERIIAHLRRPIVPDAHHLR